MDSIVSVIFRAIIISLLVLTFNSPLIIFVVAYNGPLDVISITVIIILSLTIFPSYTSVLFAVRKKKAIILNYLKFYFKSIKRNYGFSCLFVALIAILSVDGLFFYQLNIKVIYYLFSTLTLFAILFALNSGLLLSTFSMSIRNLILMNLAYVKLLSISSIIFLMIILVPFGLDPLIYLITIGLAIIAQMYYYSSKIILIKNNITDESIKYL